ncbi:MAG TPA: NUDIX hydrolase [Polyangiales bacterium]
MRSYWKLRRPTTHGALVAIWSRGEVLLVKNSYVPYYSAPGGYLQPGETGRDAALRELAEEVAVFVRPEQLELAADVTHDWEGKRDHVQVFNLSIEQRPEVRIDHREVVAARWLTPGQVVELNVFPPLKRVITAGLSAG